jgi:hypothetical protein
MKLIQADQSRLAIQVDQVEPWKKSDGLKRGNLFKFTEG